MGSQNFELIVITPEATYPQETLWVNRLFAKGLATLHLRKPGWSREQLLEYLGMIDHQFHKRIMLHCGESMQQHVEVKGRNYPIPMLPTVKPSYTVSCSTHSWQEYEALKERIDYAFVSPFFDSISKKGYRANGSLRRIPANIDRTKVVALGGIGPGNILEVQRMRLKGAAVLGAVWQGTDPLKAFVQLKNKIEAWENNDPM